MNVKRIAALGLTGAMTVSLLTGCGVNKNATVATMGDQEIKLGVANFLARYEQANYDDMFLSWVGDGYLEQDLYGTGTNTGETIKEGVMEQLHAYYTLQNHMDEYDVELSDDQRAAITEAATAFMENNSKQALREMGATQEIVEEVLTLLTIHSMMYDAIIADVDLNVTDEEANMRGYTTIKIATDYSYVDGTAVAYTEDEITELQVMAQAMVAEIKAGSAAGEDAEGEDIDTEDTDSEEADVEDEDSEDADSEDADAEDEEADAEDEDTEEAETADVMDTVAAAYGYSSSYATYDINNEDLDEAVIAALDELSEGDDPVIVTTETAIYILRLDCETDEEATENNREQIIKTRKDDRYNGVLEAWQEDDGWTINEKALAKIKFRNYFTTVTESAEDESVEGTEE